MSKNPKRWQETIISSPFGDLTKQDVHDYYANPAVRDKILKAVRGTGSGETILRQSFSPKRIILRRKDHKGSLINLNGKKEFNAWNQMRMTEIHPVFGQTTNTLLADIDPGEKVPWEKTKAIADTIAKTMASEQGMKDVKVQFSGDRGFYVKGLLNKKIDVNEARNKVKDLMRGIAQRPDVTLGKAKVDQIRIDTTPLKNRGSIKAPFSLSARTGLVAAPVKLKDLMRAKREDFKINKIKTAAALMHKESVIQHEGRKYVLYSKSTGKVLGRHSSRKKALAQERAIQAHKHTKKAAHEDILEGVETPELRGQLSRALTQYEKAKDPSHGIQHIREVANMARKLYPGSGVDREQLLSAAILHDIGREQEDETGIPHDIAGARMAQEYLGTFSPGVRRNISHAIRQHRTAGNPRTLLAKMVSDADALPQKMDPEVMLRRLAEYALAHGMSPEKIPENARIYAQRYKGGNNKFYTPQATAMVEPVQTEWEALKADPEKWHTRMAPYLKSAEFAPGIPAAKTIDPIPSIKNKAWTLSIQQHDAKKAGKHYDIRFVDTKSQKAYSFAVPKSRLPSKKDRMLLAIEQPTHTADYALNFQGKIPAGTYGAGTVKIKMQEPINVIKANANRLDFERKNGQRFALFRTHGNNWGFKRKKT